MPNVVLYDSRNCDVSKIEQRGECSRSKFAQLRRSHPRCYDHRDCLSAETVLGDVACGGDRGGRPAQSNCLTLSTLLAGLGTEQPLTRWGLLTASLRICAFVVIPALGRLYIRRRAGQEGSRHFCAADGTAVPRTFPRAWPNVKFKSFGKSAPITEERDQVGETRSPMAR